MKPITFLASAAVLTFAAAGYAANVIVHSVIGAGGGLVSSERYSIQATIGEPVTEPASSERYSLKPGFFHVVGAAGVPAATVTSAGSRKASPSAPGGFCDTNLLPPRKSEMHQGGITEVRIGFDIPPGGGGSGASLHSATCATGAFAADASAFSGSVTGNTLVLNFSPGLANAKTYRIDLGPTITSIGGQSVEVRGLAGDASSDGLVNASDRSFVVGTWTGPGFSCPTDVNNDGVTNATDRSVVVGAWTSGQNCAP